MLRPRQLTKIRATDFLFSVWQSFNGKKAGKMYLPFSYEPRAESRGRVVKIERSGDLSAIDAEETLGLDIGIGFTPM